MTRLIATLDARTKAQLARLPKTPARKLKANILASPLHDQRTKKISSSRKEKRGIIDEILRLIDVEEARAECSESIPVRRKE